MARDEYCPWAQTVAWNGFVVTSKVVSIEALLEVERRRIDELAARVAKLEEALRAAQGGRGAGLDGIVKEEEGDG